MSILRAPHHESGSPTYFWLAESRRVPKFNGLQLHAFWESTLNKTALSFHCCVNTYQSSQTEPERILTIQLEITFL